jgi:AraC family transcriptional regulator
MKNSNNSQLHSNNGKKNLPFEDYVCDDNSTNKRKLTMKKNIEISEMPAMNVIYCRHTGQFDQIGNAYEKLFRWAGPRGLLAPGMQCITYYHDDPNVTSTNKVRQSACLVTKGDSSSGATRRTVNIAGSWS